MHWYNEIDPYAAEWLRRLVAAGQLPPGDVDERDIRDVLPADLDGYTQCHFFAGVGGWPLALRLAGWPDNRPVWTGSCPCQPFSAAGKNLGFADERHLWPDWFWLIGECRPPVVLGEQVAQATKHGWLDTVFADLEGEGYACGASVLPACSVGAPHIRQRCWFVANTYRDRLEANADETVIRNATAHGWFSGRLGKMGGSPIWIEPRPPGAVPLAMGNGIPGQVGRLRAYGNAIVPQVAAEFIKASGLL